MRKYRRPSQFIMLDSCELDDSSAVPVAYGSPKSKIRYDLSQYNPFPGKGITVATEISSLTIESWHKVAGFVLTGGESSRMGRDKALLPAGNSVMVEAVAGTLAAVTEEVFLVGRPDRYAGLAFPCLPDLRPGLGPLSGLETVLASRRAGLNVVVACDLAGLRANWITSLLQAITPEVQCAAVLDRNGKLQPLCAVYRADCLERVTKAIDEGRLRALDLLAELKAVKVSIDDVILNLNTPEEFERWATSK